MKLLGSTPGADALCCPDLRWFLSIGLSHIIPVAWNLRLRAHLISAIRYEYTAEH